MKQVQWQEIENIIPIHWWSDPAYFKYCDKFTEDYNLDFEIRIFKDDLRQKFIVNIGRCCLIDIEGLEYEVEIWDHGINVDSTIEEEITNRINIL